MRSSKFVMEITPENLPENIKAKVLRRAKRHFEGKSIVHRVVSKNDDTISFKFNRTTCKYPAMGIGTVVTVKKVTSEKKSSAAKKPATKKPATKKPATKKPATKKPATKKPATKKPATKKPATKKAAKPKSNVTNKSNSK